MWSDIQPQPNFDYVKNTIAKAINVRAADLRAKAVITDAEERRRVKW